MIWRNIIAEKKQHKIVSASTGEEVKPSEKKPASQPAVKPAAAPAETVGEFEPAA